MRSEAEQAGFCCSRNFSNEVRHDVVHIDSRSWSLAGNPENVISASLISQWMEALNVELHRV